MAREEEREASEPVCPDCVRSFFSWNRGLHPLIGYAAGDFCFSRRESLVILGITEEYILSMKEFAFRPLCIIRPRVFEVN